MYYYTIVKYVLWYVILYLGYGSRTDAFICVNSTRSRSRTARRLSLDETGWTTRATETAVVGERPGAASDDDKNVNLKVGESAESATGTATRMPTRGSRSTLTGHVVDSLSDARVRDDARRRRP